MKLLSDQFRGTHSLMNSDQFFFAVFSIAVKLLSRKLKTYWKAFNVKHVQEVLSIIDGSLLVIEKQQYLCLSRSFTVCILLPVGEITCMVTCHMINDKNHEHVILTAVCVCVCVRWCCVFWCVCWCSPVSSTPDRLTGGRPFRDSLTSTDALINIGGSWTLKCTWTLWVRTVHKVHTVHTRAGRYIDFLQYVNIISNEIGWDNTV